MAEQEKKLGPNVTYMNPDKGSKLITVAGVLMKEGEAVDLEKKLGKAQAAPILKKLSGNRYFKVDGGPDHGKTEEEKPPAPDMEQSNWAVQEEARLRKTEGDEAADKFIESLDMETGSPKTEGGKDQGQKEAKKAEENYRAPEKPTLETPPPPRRRSPE